MPVTGENITELLRAHRAGDDAAFDRLVEVLYDELRRLARRWRQAPDATLNTTALVREAYVKMAGADYEWQDRAHFLAASAQAMRHIAVDYARTRGRKKRGGDRVRTDLDERHAAVSDELDTILAVDDALGELQEDSPRSVRVVECRYFAGMTVEETAAALDVSSSTVEREWRRAKADLKERIGRGKAS